MNVMMYSIKYIYLKCIKLLKERKKGEINNKAYMAIILVLL